MNNFKVAVGFVALFGLLAAGAVVFYLVLSGGF